MRFTPGQIDTLRHAANGIGVGAQPSIRIYDKSTWAERLFIAEDVRTGATGMAGTPARAVKRLWRKLPSGGAL